MMKQAGSSGTRGWLARSGAMLGSAAALLVAGRAWAQDEPPSKASCARAYESAQESRAAGHLQETQKRLSVCARPECPSFVQKDCARWLEEVERELPSVVVTAPGLEPEAASQVNIQIDGVPMPGALGGVPMTLDPGPHELVAEAPGLPRLQRSIVAQQGVQRREVQLDFGPTSAPASESTAVLEMDTGTPSPLRPYAYVAWGAGAIGLGAFVVLGTIGRADERALEQDCPAATTDPTLVMPGVCSKSGADERKSIYEREFLFADVGLVTGIIGAAAGTALFILSATGSTDVDEGGDSAGVRLDIEPAPGGGFASVAGAF